MYGDGGFITISGASNTFSNCSAGYRGGAIFCDTGCDITINGTSNTFTNCTAPNSGGRGGAIYGSSGCNITISGVSNTFTNCISTQSNGGAMYGNSPITVSNCNFDTCHAGLNGGAIYGKNSIIVSNCSFDTCSANLKGGAIHTNNIITVSNCSFDACSAGNDGGAIFLLKPATLTISGPVSFSGNMATRGSDIFMRSGTNFIFDTSANVTIPNPIDSELGGTVGGGLTKQGSGKLSLNGDNTYTGTTTVTQGELNINGSVITNVEVQPNGILSGNLSINNGKTLTNDGLISPGNGNIGSMTIEGSFTQSSQGTLEVDITPTANDADKVFVITPSIANIDGTLLVNIGSGNYIKGTLYKVIEGQTNISPSLTIQKTGALANLVDIKIIEGSIQLEINNTVIFSHPSLPQGNPLMIIDAFIALDIQENTPLVQIVEALGLLNYPGPLADVLNKMTAANYANLEWMTLTSDTQLSYILGHRAHSLKCAKRGECGTEKNKGVWISGFGNFENTKPFDWLSGYDADTGGALIGFDVCTHPFYFGFGGGYAYTDFHLKQNSGSGDIQSGFGAIYGGFISKYFIADASVIVGGKHFDMHRKVAFLMINETAYAKFNAPFVNAHLGLMGQVLISDFRLELFGNIDYHYLQLGSILETGSSINLFINRHHSHFLKTELGINLKGIFKHGKVCYAPFVGVSGVVKTPLGNTNYGAFFADNTFYQNTLTSNDSQLLVSPRCGIRIYAAPFIIMIGYKGEFNRYTKDHQVDGSLEWTF